ncbi:hypothetical protein DB459_02130 [Bradyrhizobium sp. WD16]|nr:hypothetical protein DB459_02130 [Bradyrhizobium sp. WD16]
MAFVQVMLAFDPSLGQVLEQDAATCITGRPESGTAWKLGEADIRGAATAMEGTSERMSRKMIRQDGVAFIASSCSPITCEQGARP